MGCQERDPDSRKPPPPNEPLPPDGNDEDDDDDDSDISVDEEFEAEQAALQAAHDQRMADLRAESDM